MLKKIQKIHGKIKQQFLRFSIVDRCLICFMIVLMLQMALNIFVLQRESNTDEIDVVVRTTAAAIFGYFLSNNFTRHYISKQQGDETECVYKEKSKNESQGKSQQIIVIFCVGIVSLFFLVVLRNMGAMTSEIQATISQLRDFISGCVGFLIGSPVNNNSDQKK